MTLNGLSNILPCYQIVNIHCNRVRIFLFKLFVEDISRRWTEIIICWNRHFFFSSMLQRGPNPIFSQHVTQPNLCLQFDAHDSMNGVIGQKHMHGAPSNANWQGSHCLGLWESIIFMDVWAVYQWDMKQHCLNRSLHRSPVQCLIYCIPMLLAISVNAHNIMEMTDCNT